MSQLSPAGTSTAARHRPRVWAHNTRHWFRSARTTPMLPATKSATSAADPFGADPLYVYDANAGLTLPAAPAFTGSLHTFSTWSEDLRAQVSNASVTSYTWNFSQAPDATAITGTNTYNAKFTWASFTGAAHSDTITVSEMSSGGQLSQSMTYAVAGTDAPGYTSSRPTTAATWPTVVAPNTISARNRPIARTRKSTVYLFVALRRVTAPRCVSGSRIEAVRGTGSTHQPPSHGSFAASRNVAAMSFICASFQPRYR